MILYQPKDGYCYNSDTHCLFDFITVSLKIFKNIKGELLDIGSGSGILGLLLKREYDKISLNSCEIQDDFVFLTKKNSEINNLPTTIYQGSFLDIVFDKKFDMIVSNPPFYPSSVIKSENKNIKIARYNDNLPLEQFIQKSANILNPSGKFFFCYDVKLLNDIIYFLKKYKLNIEAIQFLHPNIQKDATLVMIYARKGSKTLMKVLPPLVMFKDKVFTQKVKDIYEKCDTHSIKVEL